MIHELRSYLLWPNLRNQYLRAVTDSGLRIRGDRAGRLLGFWLEVAPDPNRVHHLWAHASLDRREADRSALLNDVEWRDEFLAQALPAVRRQNVRLMTPVRSFGRPSEARDTNAEFVVLHACAKSPEAPPYRVVEFRAEGRPSDPTRIGAWVSLAPDPNEIMEMFAASASGLPAVLKREPTSSDDVAIVLMRPADFSPSL